MPLNEQKFDGTKVSATPRCNTGSTHVPSCFNSAQRSSIRGHGSRDPVWRSHQSPHSGRHVDRTISTSRQRRLAQRASIPRSANPSRPAFGGADFDRRRRSVLASWPTPRTTPTAEPILSSGQSFSKEIAANLLTLGDELVERTMAENRASRDPHRGRTGAHRGAGSPLCISCARSGLWRRATIIIRRSEESRAHPGHASAQDRAGTSRGVRRQQFPLLYSVAGGDTASALAAGCPVIVKAHFSHLGTSELVGRAIQKAVADLGLHEGVFSSHRRRRQRGRRGTRRSSGHPGRCLHRFTGRRHGAGSPGAAAPRADPRLHRDDQRQPSTSSCRMRSHHAAKRLRSALPIRWPRASARYCLKPGLLIAIEGNGFGAMRSALQDAVSGQPGSDHAQSWHSRRLWSPHRAATRRPTRGHCFRWRRPQKERRPGTSCLRSTPTL